MIIEQQFRCYNSYKYHLSTLWLSTDTLLVFIAVELKGRSGNICIVGLLHYAAIAAINHSKKINYTGNWYQAAKHSSASVNLGRHRLVWRWTVGFNYTAIECIRSLDNYLDISSIVITWLIKRRIVRSAYQSNDWKEWHSKYHNHILILYLWKDIQRWKCMHATSAFSIN